MASTSARLGGPESRLLLALAAGESWDPLVRDLAGASLDWARFTLLAQQERAEAIVAARLARLKVSVPPDARETLARLALQSDLRMAMLSRRLDETLAAFEAAGIPVVLLKGAALGRTRYGSLPRRPMLDLDVLVHPEDAPGAREAALSIGWVPGEMERKVEFYRGHYHLPPLHDADGRNFNLEIHVGLFPEGHPFAWAMSDLWDRSVALPGGAARVPSGEDLMLHVGLHFMWSHAGVFGPWRAMRDTRVLAEQPGLDWDRLVALARATRASSALYWTLRLARLTAGAAVPASVEAALDPRMPGFVRPMVDRHFAGQWFGGEVPCPSRRLAQWCWELAIRPAESGHGAVRPWDRVSLFRTSAATEMPESGRHKLLRHLGSSRDYVRYLNRTVRGAG